MDRYTINNNGANKSKDGVWVIYEDAQAEIARLQAEVEQQKANVALHKFKRYTARNDALEEVARVSDEYEQQMLASAIRALKTGEA